MKSDQIASGKGGIGLVFWVHHYFTLPLPLLLFYSHIYQCSNGKERKKSHKTVYVFVRVCTCVCVHCNHLTLCIKGLTWVAVGGGGRSVRIEG